jgi:Holliday junction resolvase-like predicted endonuclease
MAVSTIVTPSVTLDPQLSTAKVFPGSKNLPYSIQLEKLAYLYLQKSHGAKLLRHRYRTPFGEIDLLMRLPSGALMVVEVKSWNHQIPIEHRISIQQKKRLRRVLFWLSEKHQRVEMALAMVSPEGEILIIEDSVL